MLRTILAVKLFAAVDDVQRAWLHKVAARAGPDLVRHLGTPHWGWVTGAGGRTV